MSTVITIDPVTRVAGHFNVEVTLESVGGQQEVVDAKCTGMMYRGFERIMRNRNTLDAPQLTQRICGGCSVAHSLASCLAIEDAFNTAIPSNARIMRNLVLGANFLESHLMHFYQMVIFDYISTDDVTEMAPWSPPQGGADLITGSFASQLFYNSLSSLRFRRTADLIGARFGGKMPCVANFVPGGITEFARSEFASYFRARLSSIRSFINNTFLPDVQALTSLSEFADYYNIGVGCGDLIAYGAFDLDDTSEPEKLFARSRLTSGVYGDVNASEVFEDIAYSWYDGSAASCLTNSYMTQWPEYDPSSGYSWVKSPRYKNLAYETGPLARMTINGEYTGGISVFDRLMARALETKKIADVMDGWIDELVEWNRTYEKPVLPTVPAYSTVSGIGLTESPRGALAHYFLDYGFGSEVGSEISNYNVITPTAWNASPKDNSGQHGPIEQALIGTAINDPSNPIELVRIVHSFDPCVSCAVH